MYVNIAFRLSKMNFVSGKKGEISDLSIYGTVQEEKFLLEMFAQITSRLKSKFNYTDDEIHKFCFTNEIFIPVYIFSGNIIPAESLAKFLRENQNLDYSEIANLIGRDNKSIWSNYKRAVKKMLWNFESKEGLSVPISAFNSEMSILESLVVYLKDERQFANSKIAKLLNKNPSNIWTLYKRANIKRKNKK